ncbi:MAG: 3-dehydroquinate synthase family protein, partial [Spirochaetota bacterium]
MLTLEEAGNHLLVFDTNTYSLFKKHIISGSPVSILKAGEKYKTWESVDTILSACIENSIGRDGCLLGIGGGVVCDMTAFAASIFMRGCGLILVPTTLLAMVDASLGGKTGIDYSGYKNMAGTFYPAKEIRICLRTLMTLPDTEYLSGLAEVIKHALLKDFDLLNLLEREKKRILNRDLELLGELVARAIAVKGGIVEKDFFEHGVRAYLNFGHTFAHAL